MTQEVTCSVCEKTFQQINNTALAQAVGRDDNEKRCYSCALNKLIGNRAPEEGDYNSALLISGEMSEAEYVDHLRDLRNIELGISDHYEGLNECDGHAYDCICSWCWPEQDDDDYDDDLSDD